MSIKISQWRFIVAPVKAYSPYPENGRGRVINGYVQCVKHSECNGMRARVSLTAYLTQDSSGDVKPIVARECLKDNRVSGDDSMACGRVGMFYKKLGLATHTRHKLVH